MVHPVPSRQSASAHWRSQRKCAELTPEKADSIFFPPPGGKSKSAKNFCSSCPVMAKCLDEQLQFSGPGFWAGTTEEERKRMVEFLGLVPSQLDEFIPPITRPRLRILKSDTYVHDPLAGVTGPSAEEELGMLG